MPTLHETIDGLNDVFFDPELFAESIIFQPLGDSDDQFTINALIDWGDEEGNNQLRGEGRATLNQHKGRTTRTNVIVDLPTRRVVDLQQVPINVSESGRDRIVVTDPNTDTQVRLAVRRVLGRDRAQMTLLCGRETQHETQPVKTRFG
ncbi:MAG: hypothetical protein AAF539_13135 [Planctomycetota bacterium]